MVTKVILQKSGMGIDEGTITRWFKVQGEQVTQGEVIAEVETAKSAQDVEAPVSGILTKILFEEGETVPVNEEIAWIEGT